MTDFSQDIKISCHNSVIKGKVSNEGHPWRNWKITLVAMDGDKEVKGKLTLLLDHVDYILHPTFKDPRRVVTKEPYLLQEKGWGEFDMRVVLYFTKNLVDPQVLLFDLNFAQSTYSTVRKVEFPNAPPEFVALLQKSPRNTKVKDEGESPEDGNIKVKMAQAEDDREKVTKKSNNNKKPTQQHKKRLQENGGSSTSNSDSEEKQIRYNSAKKKPVSTSNNNNQASSKKPTVLKSTKSEEASPNTSSIPSTPASIAQTESKPSTSKKRKHQDRLLDEVHIYSVDDVDKISPIHSFPIDDDTRRRWKIPKCNMKELAKRIMGLNKDQMKKFQTLLIDNLNDDMDIRVNAENKDVTIDLYSLGTSFLQKLWEFTEESISSTTTTKATSKASTSSTITNHNEDSSHNKKEEPGGGGGDGEEEEDGEVFEQGEYHSDEDDYINHRANNSNSNRTGSGQQRSNGYRNYISDQNERYSSDHQSDMENDVGHHYNNHHHQHHHISQDYHDNSDMDIQDDDE